MYTTCSSLPVREDVVVSQSVVMSSVPQDVNTGTIRSLGIRVHFALKLRSSLFPLPQSHIINSTYPYTTRRRRAVAARERKALLTVSDSTATPRPSFRREFTLPPPPQRQRRQGRLHHFGGARRPRACVLREISMTVTEYHD